MQDILDHLGSLRVFEAVARLGSIRLAASELGVTDGAVSKQIKGLEATLNTDLFIRGHRKMVMTEEAEQLAATLGASFESIVRAAEKLKWTTAKNSLVIAAPSTFLVRWLMPRLPDLEDRIRGTQINILTWNKDITTADRSIDIHVVVGNDAAPAGMTRHVIGPETFGPVLRAADYTPDMRPEDILSLRRLGTSWPTAMWRNWSSETGNLLDDHDVHRFERLLFALEGAEAGMGVALAPGPAVWDALAAKRLVAPFGLHERNGTWALMWREDQSSGLHASVLRWFEKQFAESAIAAAAVS